tara:strand:+ start:3399 stop:4118 length:720 start_codon:yes stop_codon:yes gene_type:complete
MDKVGIIIPAYNEEKNVEKLIKQIQKCLHKPYIVLVDDSDNYKTSEIIKNKKIKVQYFHRKIKSGRGSAVLFGLQKMIKNKNITAFVEMDADFSHKPSELKRNLKHFYDKNSDLLIASRYLTKSKIVNWPIPRRILSILSNKLARLLLRIPVTDYTNGYRIYSKRAVSIITKKCGRIGDGFIVLSEIITMIYLKKYKIDEIHTIFINRVRGESSVSLKLFLQSLIGLFKIFLIKIFRKI